MRDTFDSDRVDRHSSATASATASAAATGTGRDNELDDTEKFILEMLVRLDEADSQAENLKRALGHSRDIGAAIGIVMAFRKMTQDEAFDWLRQSSQDRNRKLYDVALDVIATGDCRDVSSSVPPLRRAVQPAGPTVEGASGVAPGQASCGSPHSTGQDMAVGTGSRSGSRSPEKGLR